MNYITISDSLKDSNSPKMKTTEEQGVGVALWLVALRGVEGRAGTLGWD